MPSIQAVLFDYGLVLSGPADPAAWERMKRLLHTDEPAFHAAYWKFRHDYDRGALSSASYWASVAADVHAHADASTLTHLIHADTDLWTQPNPPMIDWAAALQRTSIKTGILSNIGDAMEAGVLHRCPWLQNFTHRTFSHNLKIAKPDPAIYQHAAFGLGVAPQHILFIDDREDNIAAARQAGMQTVHYTSHDDFLRSMRAQGFDHLLQPAH